MVAGPEEKVVGCNTATLHLRWMRHILVTRMRRVHSIHFIGRCCMLALLLFITTMRIFFRQRHGTVNRGRLSSEGRAQLRIGIVHGPLRHRTDIPFGWTIFYLYACTHTRISLADSLLVGPRQRFSTTYSALLCSVSFVFIFCSSFLLLNDHKSLVLIHFPCERHFFSSIATRTLL